MPAHGNWIDHFPDNFTWSNATLVTKGMAPYGAVALEEIDRIGAKMQQRRDDQDVWWQEWSAMAAQLEQHADAAAADEGGAEHCHVDNRQVGIDYVGDWLAQNL